MTRAQVEKTIEELNQSSVQILINDDVKSVNYGDLGVEINVEETMRGLRGGDILSRLDNWLHSFWTTTLIYPVVEFSDDFEKRVLAFTESEDEFKEKWWFDEDRFSFVYEAEGHEWTIDVTSLMIRLTTSIGNRAVLIRPEIRRSKSWVEKKIREGNLILAKMFSKPVDLVVRDEFGKTREKEIEVDDLKNMVEVRLNDIDFKVEVIVEKDKLSQYLIEGVGKDVSVFLAKRKIEVALDRRMNDMIEKIVVLGIDDGPNTDGTEAEKYVEVDLSQQEMYLFSGGKLVDRMSVSTGLYYPTPVGEFKIINKAENAFSSIFGVWMPYWMAFEYSDELKAYLGIHELPYKVVNGKRFYRFGNYIGEKKTGGCVALPVEKSERVFDFSEVGMKVMVFD